MLRDLGGTQEVPVPVVLEVVVNSMRMNLLHALSGPHVDEAIKGTIERVVTVDAIQHHMEVALSKELEKFAHDVAHEAIRKNDSLRERLVEVASEEIDKRMEWYRKANTE